MLKREDIEERMEAMQKALDYEFTRKDLLLEALTHRSYANEARPEALPDNDRLEFLGDSVLDLVVAHLLMEGHPDFDAGMMTKTRAALVNESGCERAARSYDMGRYIMLGIGETRSGGAEKASVLSHIYEAMLGAIYLDGGLQAAWRVIERDMGEQISRADMGGITGDYKSALQEYCAKRRDGLPQYKVIQREGPDHAAMFTVECSINGKALGEGKGHSIKLGEQRAALKTLGHLKGTEEKDPEEKP